MVWFALENLFLLKFLSSFLNIFFGLFNFSFAPLLFQLCHRIGDWRPVYKALVTDWSPRSDSLLCYQIGMDLLYERKHYDKVLQVWRNYCKQSALSKTLPYPKAMQALVTAACYKIVCL